MAPKDSHLQTLKSKLTNFGAIRPQAWTKILTHLKVTELKFDESFNREIGSLVYVADGLLKEYDAQLRKKPAIVNFISAGNFLVTNKSHHSKYTKTIGSAKLVHVTFESLIPLFLKYNELKSIYEGISSNYENGMAFRQLLLEENVATARIQLFINKYRTILPLLKKKDIANYTHIDYEYFIRIYGKQL